MKQYITRIFLLFLPCFLQAQDILWEKSFGGGHAEYLFDALPTPDYGFILAGSSISGKEGNKTDESKGNFDYWIWKMNEKGDLDWQKSFGGSGDDFLQSVKLTSDGGFILAGISNSPKDGDKKEACKGETDFWVVKLDATGGELWQRTIGGTGLEKLYSIAPTKDGGYIIGGTSGSNKTLVSLDKKEKEDPYGKKQNTKGNLDYWVVKLTKKGEIEWQKTIGGCYIDELRSIEQTQDGGYIVGGVSNSPISGDKDTDAFGEDDFWILKLNPEGSIQWQQTLGGSGDDELYSLIQTQDGGYMAGGNSNSSASHSKTKANGKGTDFWVFQLDAKGQMQWQETYNFGNYDVLTSIVENPDGSYLIGGYAQKETSSTPNTGIVAGLQKSGDKEGINDYIALKISPTGENIWTRTVGSKGDEILRRLFETRDGGYLLAGTSSGVASADKNTSLGSSDFWVVKLKDKTKPEKPKINIEAIPNPALTFTNIIIGYEFERGTATVVDMAGRTLQQFSISNRTVPVDLSRYPNGVYIVNISTNIQSDGVKVIKRGSN